MLYNILSMLGLEKERVINGTVRRWERILNVKDEPPSCSNIVRG